MPVFRIETEDGRWLADMRLAPPDWKPGDRIARGRDSLEVVVVRGETLIVRRHIPPGG